MELRDGETVLKVYRRHTTPYIWLLLRVTIIISPLAFILWFVADSLAVWQIVLIALALFILYLIIIAYVSLVYWLDSLCITDHRIIFTNWHNIFRREEFEASLQDIQEIKTRENGFLAGWKFFDYGQLHIETASSKTTIEFDNAPDPEGIKVYLVKRLSPKAQNPVS